MGHVEKTISLWRGHETWVPQEWFGVLPFRSAVATLWVNVAALKRYSVNRRSASAVPLLADLRSTCPSRQRLLGSGGRREDEGRGHPGGEGTVGIRGSPGRRTGTGVRNAPLPNEHRLLLLSGSGRACGARDRAWRNVGRGWCFAV